MKIYLPRASRQPIFQALLPNKNIPLEIFCRDHRFIQNEVQCKGWLAFYPWLLVNDNQDCYINLIYEQLLHEPGGWDIKLSFSTPVGLSLRLYFWGALRQTDKFYLSDVEFVQGEISLKSCTQPSHSTVSWSRLKTVIYWMH